MSFIFRRSLYVVHDCPLCEGVRSGLIGHLTRLSRRGRPGKCRSLLSMPDNYTQTRLIYFTFFRAPFVCVSNMKTRSILIDSGTELVPHQIIRNDRKTYSIIRQKQILALSLKPSFLRFQNLRAEFSSRAIEKLRKFAF